MIFLLFYDDKFEYSNRVIQSHLLLIHSFLRGEGYTVTWEIYIFPYKILIINIYHINCKEE